MNTEAPMNADPALCSEIRALLADHVDGLLDDAQAARAYEHLARCEDCAAEAQRARRIHAALAAPWDVPAPSPDLPLLALATARARRTGAGRVVGVALRYAATFAAGVLAAFLVLGSEPARPSAGHSPPPTEIAHPAPASSVPVDLPDGPAPTYSPRRIR
jgi:anti-sigma factor RsiW